MIRLSKFTILFSVVSSISLTACLSSNNNQIVDKSDSLSKSVNNSTVLLNESINEKDNLISLNNPNPTPSASNSLSELAFVPKDPIASIKIYISGLYQSKNREMLSTWAEKGFFPLTPDFPDYFEYTGKAQLSKEMFEKYSSQISKWILVDVHETPDSKPIASVAAILLKDGTVADPNDLSQAIHFPGLSEGEYHVAIYSNMVLPVMSSEKVKFFINSENHLDARAAALFDFTKSETQYLDMFGQNAVAHKFDDGTFGLWNGNSDHNDIADMSDYTSCDNNRTSEPGFYSCDLNADLIVDQVDINEIEKPVSSFAYIGFKNAKFLKENTEPTKPEPSPSPISSSSINNTVTPSEISELYLKFDSANMLTLNLPQSGSFKFILDDLKKSLITNIEFNQISIVGYETDAPLQDCDKISNNQNLVGLSCNMEKAGDIGVIFKLKLEVAYKEFKTDLFAYLKVVSNDSAPSDITQYTEENPLNLIGATKISISKLFGSEYQNAKVEFIEKGSLKDGYVNYNCSDQGCEPILAIIPAELGMGKFLIHVYNEKTKTDENLVIYFNNQK